MADWRIRRLEQLFQEHYEPLCRWIYRIVGDVSDTVDVVQETFLRYWTWQHSDSGESRGVGYLYRTAQNLALDVLRKRAVRQRRLPELGSQQVIVLPVTPEDRVMAMEKSRLVRAALEELNERQRTCLELRACGLTYEEIAEAVEMNPESVGPTLTRALRKFRAVYERLQRQQPVGRKDARTK